MIISKKTGNFSLIFKSGIASVDQAMLSALNLLISIILIKTVSKAEYGYYSIAFSITLFLISIQNAIVNAPLAVLYASKKRDEKKRYCASLCYGQFIGIIPASCLGFVVIGLFSLNGMNSTQATIGAAVSFAAIGILFREFLRAYFYAKESPFNVLKLDVFYTVLFLLLLTTFYLVSKISVAGIFALMGVSSFFIGLIHSKGQGWRFRHLSVRASYYENWIFGKWILLGIIVTHIQRYGYLYMIGAFLGSHGAAEVTASRLIMMPLMLAQEGWGRVIVPHGSRLREENNLNLFFKQLVLASGVFIFVVSTYTTLLFLFSQTIQRFLLTDKYENAFDFIFFWGIIFVIRLISRNASGGLIVIKKFHTITTINFCTMLITIGCAFFLIQESGIKGALMSLIIGDAILALGLWFYLAKHHFYLNKSFKNRLKKISSLDFTKGEGST
jgi:O-antigen/teichoic acid export membrane protein